MRIRGCVSTDAGDGRDVCTDAAVLKVASSGRYGRIAFAVLCDGAPDAEGAGKASAMAAERMAEWFQEELPQILQEAETQEAEYGESFYRARMLTEVLHAEDTRSAFMRRMFQRAQEQIRLRLQEICDELNTRINGYARLHHIRMGTSMTCLLLMGNEYLLMRVGAQRAVLMCDDSALADLPGVREEHGGFGEAEAVTPVFVRGMVSGHARMLLYSDGFIRRQDPERLEKLFRKCLRFSERRMEDSLKKMTRFARRRGERGDAFAVFLSCIG